MFVVSQDARQLEGRLRALSGRDAVGDVVFDEWQIETVEDDGSAPR